MPDDPYSLGDLARLAGVTPRTVRYYVAQGLLPSPDPAGPATRYGGGHLARLRLIRRLQRGHLPLAEIRVRLERLDDDAVAASLDATDATVPDPSISPGETLAFVRGLIARSGVEIEPRGVGPQARLALRRTAPAPASEPGPATPAVAPFASPIEAAARPPAGIAHDMTSSPGAAPGPGRAPLPAAADRSTWERLAITPDVEIHVRRPLDRFSNKRVEQLARMARELFDEEA